MDISDIKRAVGAGRVKITGHADAEAQNDLLSFDEIFYAVLDGEIIADYPDDKPYPSCLVFGRSFSGDPIHSVWAYNEQTQWAVLITVYRPDPAKWANWRKRKKQQ
jgi:hypothetical protein